MKKFIANNKFYIVSSLLILILSLIIHPIYDIGFEAETPFYKKIRFIQFISTSVICFLYYLFFLKDNAKYSKFYKDNVFYSGLLYFTTMGIILSTIYFFNWEVVEYETKNGNHLNLITHKSVKIWEVGSYLITFIYTVWLWYSSDSGKKIRKDVQKTYEDFAFLRISPALLLLFIIISIHTYIIFFNNIEFLKHYSIVLTLSLIFLTYIIFNSITKQVVKVTDITDKLTPNEIEERTKINKEFKMALKYIERPTLIIFGIMLVYALYCTLIGVIHEMEIFFSGAIAFELLLSSIVWAKTETV